MIRRLWRHFAGWRGEKPGILVVPNILLYENGKTYESASLLIQKDGTIVGVQKMVHIAQAEPVL